MTTQPKAQARIALFFEETDRTEKTTGKGKDTAVSLWKVIFSHPLLDSKRISVRGNGSGALEAGGSFQWSQGVRALCVLLLRGRWSQLSDVNAASKELSGHGGSLASSLDYALGKQPNWLLDMFGVDKRGTSLARRLIRRSNPERRRPGPVVLSINSHFVPLNVIDVFVGGVKCEGASDFKRVLCALEDKEDSCGAATDTGAERPVSITPKSSPLTVLPLNDFPTPFHTQEARNRLKSVFQRELLASLRHTDVFKKNGVREIYDALKRFRTLQPLLTSGNSFVSDIDSSLSSSERMGILSDPLRSVQEVSEFAPFTVCLPCMHTSSLSIFRYLKNIRGVPLEILAGFQHSTQIARRLLNSDFTSPPDLVVVDVATALHILQHQSTPRYSSLMALPGLTHRVIAPESARGDLKRSKSLNFHFMHQIPTLASVYFEELLRKDGKKLKNASVLETEVCDTAEILRDHGSHTRVILACPYYDLNVAFNKSVAVDEGYALGKESVAVLLVSSRIISDTKRAKLLNIFVRDAWLGLMGRVGIREQVLSELVEDSEYLSIIKRASGLHMVSIDEGPNGEVDREAA